MNQALFRRHTSDAAIWDSVVENNEYKLPGKFEPNSLVLDIGGNTGAFSYACLQRGAAKVLAFEPDPDNYGLFRKQLRQEIKDGRVEIYPLAVVGGSGFSWRTFSGVVRSDGQINHGGAFLFSPDGNDHGLGEFIVNRPFKVPCISMQEVTELLPPENEFNRKMMKLDCEGSEWGILAGSYTDEWDEIVGEYHPHTGFEKEDIGSFLKPDNFKVEFVPHPNSELGLFFARK